MRMIRTLRGALSVLAVCLTAAAIGGCGSTHHAGPPTRTRASTTTAGVTPRPAGVTYGIGDAQGLFARCATDASVVPARPA